MRIKIAIGIAVLVCFPRIQDKQVVCESNFLSEAGAKEITSGPEYERFLEVVAAFGRTVPPRLYFVPGPGSSIYIAGSIFVDGRGKILMSRTFVSFMGNTPALTGVMAHEMAHLAVDVWGNVSCYSKFLRDPREEDAADALAARKVGFGPVRAFLLRVEEVTGAYHGEEAARLQELETLEVQEYERR